MSITLVLGLGNPGRDYAETRHNIGWIVLDELARREGLTWKHQAAFQADVARWNHPSGRPVLLAKPLTFMNDSGRAARAVASYYKLSNSAIAAVYDDLNIDLGLVKVSDRGSAGGHNGVSDLLEKLGQGFIRYRLGIGPKSPPQMDLKDFVLGKFTPDQRHLLDQSLSKYLSGLDLLLTSGPERAMNLLNRRVQNEPEQT
ncbi:aminoacyl-tRNA hydrolase [Actomonas aquatica]|uniref:Peptidyl-tRNA hydrolase n=1 Tax=Actomonas aquatica TaxID=2866162 RepID=A0ABZ1CAK3_9BACT|nr:aminoacyl-tRNA hydrolase [Opitutus sp. WL0086]WRQ87624.1 aminoacyl-tRNA hydrolase [Opitutus sp. WL0086]